MRSSYIRGRLLWRFVTVVAVCCFLAAGFVYFGTRAELRDALNAQSDILALTIAGLEGDTISRNSFGKGLERYAEDYLIRVWDAKGQLVVDSNTALRLIVEGAALAPAPSNLGADWETREYVLSSGEVVLIARLKQETDQLVLQLAFTSMVPITLALLGAVLTATVLVRQGLPPLTSLSQELTQRSAEDLRQLPVKDAPGELEPIIREMNGLLKRIETSLKRERTFVDDAAHELRTPLNGIIGSIHLVRDELCDSREEEMDFLEQANKAALHLLSVIEDILNIAKIEAGTLDVNITSVDLRHVLQDVLEIEGSQFQRKGLRLVRPELSEPIIIPVDHSRFKQVLLNVLSNAIKFTDNGAIAITVTTDETPEDLEPTPGELYLPSEPWVKITIQDSGIGIDPQNLSKLFKPFVMIDGSHTRPYEGTGLGLAISQNFMRLMQGDISIYSPGIGQGTTVTIVVPRIVKPKDIGDLRENGNGTVVEKGVTGKGQETAMTLRQ